MKIGFIFCTISLIIISFSQCDNLVHSWWDEYFKLKESELSSGVKNDTIILDYWFGMNESEFDSHTKKLIKEGIVKISNDEYVLELPLDYNKVPFTFVYHTYDDKLNFFKAETNDLLVIEDLKKFMIKEFGNYKLVNRSNIHYFPNHIEYYWINGNREIQLTTGY